MEQLHPRFGGFYIIVTVIIGWDKHGPKSTKTSIMKVLWDLKNCTIWDWCYTRHVPASGGLGGVIKETHRRDKMSFSDSAWGFFNLFSSSKQDHSETITWTRLKHNTPQDNLLRSEHLQLSQTTQHAWIGLIIINHLQILNCCWVGLHCSVLKS